MNLFSNLLFKLGYMPITQHAEKVTELATKIVDLRESLVTAQRTKRETEKLNIEQVQKLNEYKNLVTDTERKHKKLMTKYNTLVNKHNKLNTKHTKLVNEYASLDSEARSITRALLKEKAKFALSKQLANALDERLQYLVFGSVLPKVMSISTLDNYQHLFKPVDVKYFIDKQGNIGLISNISSDTNK